MNYKELISYDDKVNLYSNSNIPAENKVQDTDMNNIKNVVNGVINGTNVMGNIVVDSIRSKNMLNPGNMRSGGYYISNGEYFDSTSNCCTINLIKIDNTKDYVLSTNSNQNKYMFFFDSNKTFLGYTNNTGSVKASQFNNYANAAYMGIRFDTSWANVDHAQLEVGDTPTPYSQYQALGGPVLENFGSRVDYTIGEEGTTAATFRKLGKQIIITYQGPNKTHNNNTVLFTLPTDCRPPAQIIFPFTKWGGAYGQIAINTNGEVSIIQISSTSFSGRVVFNAVYTIE